MPPTPATACRCSRSRGPEGTVVGHGTYIAGPPDRAEIAFAVADAWHGHGIATVLLAHLAQSASSAGHRDVHGDRAVVEPPHAPGVPRLRLPRVGAPSTGHASRSSSRPRCRGRRASTSSERQRAADVAAVAHVLRPASIAVIGASRRPGTVGGEVVRNLLAGGFSGPLHLVNARGGEVAGRPTVRSIADVEGDVELAVIAVPAAAVVETARQCAAKGVCALVVLTAGFAEVGPEGRARQDELLAVCRAAGMRMVGPNCLGVANLHHLRRRSTRRSRRASRRPAASPSRPRAGRSGSRRSTRRRRAGSGCRRSSRWATRPTSPATTSSSTGSRTPTPSVLLVYLESFGNPRRFGRIARRITASKPIVAVKSGRTAAGHRAASSHTGALLAASDVTVDALFADAGRAARARRWGRCSTSPGCSRASRCLAGDRVAVLTNAGGPAILCADACEAAGLRIDTLSDATRARLAEVLPPEASTANPVDMIASATAEQYERSLRILLEDDAVDAVVTIFVRPLAARAAEVARGIAAAAEGADRPVLAVWLGADTPAPGDTGSVPRFASPEEAVRALGHAVRHARRRAAAAGPALRACRRRHGDRGDDRRRGTGRGRRLAAAG